MAFTLDRTITRIQEVYGFDCQCRVKQVKTFLGTSAHTQGSQGAVSSVVLEDEKRILQYLKENKECSYSRCPTTS